ncbi:hypothetical protein V9T40_011687 [Parthenolecanium corni]|uniref:Uncharacterized protein n=1 Tax=Parthenolecanium corni TaxID=536013 RepID=A0AAN9XYE0_9HEMI
MTLRAATEADAILKDVHEQTNNMCHKNRQAAMQYIYKLRDSLKEHSKSGTEKIDSVIKDNMKNITDEVVTLKTTIKNVSDRIVDIAVSQIAEITDSVVSGEKMLTKELEESISRAVDEVEAMWNGLDQICAFYTSYWSDLIEKKVQNMTEKVTYLVSAQSKLINGTVEERVRMCQNISLANMVTSNTIQSVVQLMDNLYNTTRIVGNLQSVLLDADQNTSNVLEESKSMLFKYQKDSKETLDTLLEDHFCFLGSTVRISAVSISAYLKGDILKSWKMSLTKANRAFKQATSNHLLITKKKYRSRLVHDVKGHLKSLRKEVQKKAAQLDKDGQTRFEELVNFDKLYSLMNNRFKNLTEATNSQFESSLESIGEALRFRMDFLINQKLPYLRALTIQNYLPTDVCPLSMDFANYIKKWVNEADELRQILLVDGFPPEGEAIEEDKLGLTTDYTKIESSPSDEHKRVKRE